MKYRGAIVGFGNVAVAGHLPAWRRSHSFELCAVVDPLPERLQLARSLLPGIPCYGNLEDLFTRERLDFVDICTPPALHDAALLHACKRGVHILCEKPLTLSAEVMQQLLAYTIEHERVIFTVHNWRYAPLLQALKDLLDAGTIGVPEYVEWIVLRTRPAGTTQAGNNAWRLDQRLAGGGILVDHGWHAFYLLPFLLGCEPHAIAVHLEPCWLPTDAVEDTVTGMIECTGVQAHFHLTWAGARRSNEGLVRGSEGIIRFDTSSLQIERYGKPVRRQHFDTSLAASSYHPEWFTPLLKDFQRELEDPHRRGQNLEEASRCLALILKAYESHWRDGELLPLNHTRRSEESTVEREPGGELFYSIPLRSE